MPSIEESLEATLAPKEDKRVSIKDILNTLFNTQAISQKSILSNTNITALLKMNAANRFLEDTYHIRITQFDTLIQDKLQYVISLEGRGREDFIKVIEATKDTIHIEQEGGILKR